MGTLYIMPSAGRCISHASGFKLCVEALPLAMIRPPPRCQPGRRPKGLRFQLCYYCFELVDTANQLYPWSAEVCCPAKHSVEEVEVAYNRKHAIRQILQKAKVKRKGRYFPRFRLKALGRKCKRRREHMKKRLSGSSTDANVQLVSLLPQPSSSSGAPPAAPPTVGRV